MRAIFEAPWRYASGKRPDGILCRHGMASMPHSFCAAINAVMCIRGSRSQRGQPIQHDRQLSLAESKLSLTLSASEQSNLITPSLKYSVRWKSFRGLEKGIIFLCFFVL